MGADVIWVCSTPSGHEVVDPSRLDAVTGVGVRQAPFSPNANVFAWLLATRWLGWPAWLGTAEPDGPVSDVTDAVGDAWAAYLAEHPGVLPRQAPPPTPAIEPGASRLASALEQVGQDLHVLAERHKACGEDVPEALKDAVRTVEKALDGPQAHKDEVLLRASRENMMRDRIMELVAQRDALRGRLGVMPELSGTRRVLTNLEAWTRARDLEVARLRKQVAQLTGEAADVLKPTSVLDAIRDAGGIVRVVKPKAKPKKASTKRKAAPKAKAKGRER